MQARLLERLRDDGPLSKAQLADLLQISRTTVGAEVARLGELGLAVEAGPAASRGGRRSDARRPLARHPLRRHLHRSDRTLRRRDRRSAEHARGPAPPLRHPAGAGGGAGPRHPGPAGGHGRGRRGQAQRSGGRRARPGRLPPRGLGVAADHAGLGRLPGPGRGLARAWAARSSWTTTSTCWRSASSTPGWPKAPRTSCSSRSAPASAAGSSSTASSTEGSTGAPATSVTSGSTTSARPARAATTGASRRSPVGPPWRGTRRQRPLSGRSAAAGGAARGQGGAHRGGRGDGDGSGRPCRGPADPRQRAPGRPGAGHAWCRSSTPG